MKELDEIFYKLDDVSSKYYCGSACFLSLIALCHFYKDKIAGVKTEFSLIEKKADLLMKNDAELFSLTRKKEISTFEWEFVGEAISDYGSVIANLNDILNVIHDDKIEKIFKDYLIFISRLCRYNCAYFYEVTDVPENVLTIINSALIEIQRDYKNENY